MSRFQVRPSLIQARVSWRCGLIVAALFMGVLCAPPLALSNSPDPLKSHIDDGLPNRPHASVEDPDPINVEFENADLVVIVIDREGPIVLPYELFVALLDDLREEDTIALHGFTCTLAVNDQLWDGAKVFVQCHELEVPF